MANTRELRRRIKSIKNTSQITKAMQMVAATKMRRAQNQATQGRPYLETLNYSLSKILPGIHPETHVLLNPNDVDATAIILLSTDKGLCGALNTNLFRVTQSFVKNGGKYVFYTLGKKGRQYTVRTNRNLQADFENSEKVTFKQARQFAKLLVDSYLNKEIGQAYLIYPHFVSTLRQEPKVTRLLPIEADVILNDSEGSLANASTSNKSRDSHSSLSLRVHPSESKTSPSARNDITREFLFEPSADTLLDFILLHAVETKIYQALLETKASEHSARMIAMQNATDNANELVEDLKLTYNQTRQEGITRELLEITSASAALE